jgi:hypothetical protein
VNWPKKKNNSFDTFRGRRCGDTCLKSEYRKFGFNEAHNQCTAAAIEMLLSLKCLDDDKKCLDHNYSIDKLIQQLKYCK